MTWYIVPTRRGWCVACGQATFHMGHAGTGDFGSAYWKDANGIIDDAVRLECQGPYKTKSEADAEARRATDGNVDQEQYEDIFKNVSPGWSISYGTNGKIHGSTITNKITLASYTYEQDENCSKVKIIARSNAAK